MLTALVLAVTTFVVTNIDDIFILVGFFADSRRRAFGIVLGQYLGIVVLVTLSLIAALIALAIPPVYVGLLGLVPIGLGTRQLLQALRDEEEDGPERTTSSGRTDVLTVAAVTIANGGDNFAVYIPVFSTRSSMELTVMIGVFLLMTGVWCAFAHWLVHHQTIGTPLRRYGHRALPWILIGLGVWIMFDAGFFHTVPG
jgi:cadmium resistance transport/sequestration family protein